MGLPEACSCARQTSFLLITANDGTGPNSEALLQAFKEHGNTQSQHIEMKTDHPFSDHRIALENTVLTWLEQSTR